MMIESFRNSLKSLVNGLYFDDSPLIEGLCG